MLVLSDFISFEHFGCYWVIHFFDSEGFDFLFGQGIHFWELPDACIGLDVEPLSHGQAVDVVLWVVHNTEEQLKLIRVDHIGEVEGKMG